MAYKSFRLRGPLRSLRFAWRGLIFLVRSQRNAQLHLAATVAVGVVGVLVGLSASEWCVILLAVAGVWAAEGMNASIELLADAVAPSMHPLVERAKDVAAGAVLVASLAAVGVGLLIVVPKLWALGA